MTSRRGVGARGAVGWAAAALLCSPRPTVGPPRAPALLLSARGRAPGPEPLSSAVGVTGDEFRAQRRRVDRLTRCLLIGYPSELLFPACPAGVVLARSSSAPLAPGALPASAMPASIMQSTRRCPPVPNVSTGVSCADPPPTLAFHSTADAPTAAHAVPSPFAALRACGVSSGALSARLPVHVRKPGGGRCSQCSDVTHTFHQFCGGTQRQSALSNTRHGVVAAQKAAAPWMPRLDVLSARTRWKESRGVGGYRRGGRGWRG